MHNIHLFIYLISVVAMFLGVILHDMDLGLSGQGLMIAWCVWVILLPIILELFEANHKKQKGIIYFFKLKLLFKNL